MELNHLRYFFEVAKAGSFTAAARKLRISQSALSKSVALLEDREGVKLLDRSKKGVSLTTVGTEVYRMSAGIFHTVAEIENTCRGTKETCEGYLRFGASDHVANYLLAPKLQEFRATYPNVLPAVLSAPPNDIVNAILNSELEFGLFFTRINAPALVYEPIRKISMAVVCHPKWPKKFKVGSTTAQVREFVRNSGFIGSIRSQYQHHPSKDLMKITGADTNFAFESNSQETQKRFCLEGGGVAFLARFMVEKEIEEGRLAEIPTPQPFSLELLLARRKTHPLSVNARTFLKTLGSN